MRYWGTSENRECHYGEVDTRHSWAILARLDRQSRGLTFQRTRDKKQFPEFGTRLLLKLKLRELPSFRAKWRHRALCFAREIETNHICQLTQVCVHCNVSLAVCGRDLSQRWCWACHLRVVKCVDTGMLQTKESLKRLGECSESSYNMTL